jgi:hypothetical protein
MAKNVRVTISLPNINRLKVVAFRYDRDGSPSTGTVSLEAYNSANAMFYRRYELNLSDSQAQCIVLNTTPTRYDDLISVEYRPLVGALTALITAERSAANGRNSQLSAVEDACVSTGIIDSTLI